MRFGYRVRITVRFGLGLRSESRLGLGLGLELGSGLNQKFASRMGDIEIAQRILQIAQIDKLRATVLWRANPAYVSEPGGLGDRFHFSDKGG